MERVVKELWEVLVPRAFNDGMKVPLFHHRAWDERVRKIIGGLTILKSAKGIWESPSGEIFQEEMIPVRVACTELQVNAIIDITIAHYDQIAVMAYRVSDYVIIKNRNN